VRDHPLAEKMLDVDAACDAIRDFLREWFPLATVRRSREARKMMELNEVEVPAGTHAVRAESGGTVGYMSDFPLPAGLSMALCYDMAKRLRDDWEERLSNA
jgi:hypothetical protein